MFRKQIGFALLEHDCSCVCNILPKYKFDEGAHIQQNDICYTPLFKKIHVAFISPIRK